MTSSHPKSLLCFFLGAAMLCWASVDVHAQASGDLRQDKSGLKAFALNLLVPGLGQRYLNGGTWSGWAPVYTGADAALGMGLAGTIWYRDQQIQSYRTLAAGRAEATVEGKDRAFFVQMATYRSQKRYIENLLRSRQWAGLQQAEDPGRYWHWDSEEAWEEYQATRNKSDALARRRTILITAMVANRVISGLAALLRVRSDNSLPHTGVELRRGLRGSLQPHVRMQFSW